MRNSRRNNKRGKQDKKSFVKFIPLIVLVMALAAFIVYALWPDPHDKTVIPVSVVQPKAAEAATIYIDNSASMKGYSHGDEYIGALSDLASLYPNTSVQFTSGGQTLNSGSELVNKLTNGTLDYSGQSLLNKDLEGIVNFLKTKGNENKIAFFVTDGIMCGPDSAVAKARKAGHHWNLEHRQELMNQITDVYNGKGIAASVSQLVSSFNGEYFDMDNNHSVINAQRSFYIIAMGNAAAVQEYKEKVAKKQGDPLFKIRPVQEVDFIQNHTMNTGLIMTGGVNGSAPITIGPNGTALFEYNKIKNYPVSLILNMNTFSNFSFKPSDLTDSVKVFIDGVTYKDIKAIFDEPNKAIRVNIDWSHIGTSSKIEIKIPYLEAPWLTLASNENDNFMITGRPDESTFLFNYFIGGIRNGLRQNSGDFIFDEVVNMKQNKH